MYIFFFLLDIFAILRKPSLTFFNSDNDIVYFRISRAIQSFYRRILGLGMVLILSLTNIKLSSEKGQMMSEAFSILPKKTNEIFQNFVLATRTEVFVRFLKELKQRKKIFEIN